jgi:hypothetical protein
MSLKNAEASIAEELAALDRKKQALEQERREIWWKRQKLEKAAKKSVFSVESYKNGIAQNLVPGDAVVVITGNSKAKMQGHVGTFLGVNRSQQGELRSLRVEVIKERVTYSTFPHYSNTYTPYKGKLSVGLNRVYAIRQS